MATEKSKLTESTDPEQGDEEQAGVFLMSEYNPLC